MPADRDHPDQSDDLISWISSWSGYQISSGHCTTKTSNCVFGHHLLISSSNVFKTEPLWRHDSVLATSPLLDLQNGLSSSPSLPEKDVVETSKRFCFYWFSSDHACIAGVFCSIMTMVTSLTARRAYTDLQRWGPSLLEGGDSVTIVPYIPWHRLCPIGPSVVLRPTYRPPSLLHSLAFLACYLSILSHDYHHLILTYIKKFKKFESL